MAIPDSLVEEFRAVALERLEKIEASWEHVLKELDEQASAVVHREVHTLKGEARIVGFTDVNMVAHKLEDLLNIARNNGYAVDEDFDLAVNMALRFMAMLVRKRVGTNLGGFDLPGFIRHIDTLSQQWRSETTARNRTASGAPFIKASAAVGMSRTLRDRIAPTAVDAYIEYAVAYGPRRNRLRTSWHALRDLVGIQRAVVGPDQLAKHVANAQDLARELGKSIEVKLELPAIEVTTEVLAAVDLATLHLLRNAIDHGIERPDARRAAGKPDTGVIRIQATLEDGEVELVVADDGVGIDFARVRTLAVERGLISEDKAARLDEEDWVDLLCTPGFSTRDHASEVSGRGVGLDAVRAAAVELGGELRASSQAGKGTQWRVAFAVPQVVEEVHVLAIPSLPFPLVIDAAWKPTNRPVDAMVCDIPYALGLAQPTTGSAIAFVRPGASPIAVLCDHLRGIAKVRRLVATPPSAIGEVVLMDVAEALLIRPERLIDIG